MTEQVFWSPGVSLEQIEKDVILKAFRFYRGNKTQCSISLGISIRTLEAKLEKYEQDGKKQRDTEERESADRAAQLNRARGIAVTASPTEGVVFGTGAGVHAQPPVAVPEKQPVPVSEPEKVQSVLPSKVAAGHQHRRR